MANTTFYLKYRPQKINELDLAEIRDQLKNVLSSGRPPHAYLFTGPKGLGKTSAARILAKAVNCLKFSPDHIEPCNKCEICQSMTNQTSFDLIEIDAASNRGIDDIRDLREKIKLSPSRARKKVYVIDEVHMLTTEAFNALLKSLEEPPEHALFILCTTEAQKLPETIISRCLLINFRKATVQEMSRSLQRIVKQEKLKIEKGVLEEIYLWTDGSFRDGVKILEQLSFDHKKITLQKVKEFLEKTSSLKVDQLLTAIESKNTGKSLNILKKMIEEGADLKWLARQILENLRRLMLEALKRNKSHKNYLELIDLFDKAARQLGGAVIPQLPLELAIVSWSNSKEKEQRAKSKASHSNSLGLDNILKNWQQVLKEVKTQNYSLEALLKAAKPLKIDADFLIVEVFYPFHKQKLENVKCVKIVEDKLKDVFNKKFKVKYILSKRG